MHIHADAVLGAVSVDMLVRAGRGIKIPLDYREFALRVVFDIGLVQRALLIGDAPPLFAQSRAVRVLPVVFGAYRKLDITSRQHSVYIISLAVLRNFGLV